MPILQPTGLSGRVTFAGATPDRATGLESVSAEAIELDWAGVVGDTHAGLTRQSCSRVKAQYTRGTEIKNARQLSIVSDEELAAIGADMGLPEPVRPSWIGANLAIAGLPELTRIPPGSRLLFEGGASIAVDMENGPCKYPAEVIEAAHPGLGLSFPKKALGRRGLTGWVERPGVVRVGEAVALHCPPQRIYAPAERKTAARA